MTKNSNLAAEQDPRPSSDSFMEPRTIPKKWDVSAFESQASSTTSGSDDLPGGSEATEDPATYEGEGSEATFDPFPQPRTVPGKWDVSDLV